MLQLLFIARRQVRPSLAYSLSSKPSINLFHIILIDHGRARASEDVDGERCTRRISSIHDNRLGLVDIYAMKIVIGYARDMPHTIASDDDAAAPFHQSSQLFIISNLISVIIIIIWLSSLTLSSTVVFMRLIAAHHRDLSNSFI